MSFNIGDKVKIIDKNTNKTTDGVVSNKSENKVEGMIEVSYFDKDGVGLLARYKQEDIMGIK